MANNYLQFSTGIPKLTKKEADWCRKRLAELAELEDPTTSGSSADFEWTLDEDGKYMFLWIRAGEFGNIDHVASFIQEFIRKFRPKDAFSMSWAETCSKLRLDQFGGGAMFITAEQQKFLNTGSWENEQNESWEAAQAKNVRRRSKKARS